MPKKVAIINGNSDYAELFTSRGWVVVEDLENADLVVFTGGEDVSPSLYGHDPHHTTYNNWNRDVYETGLLDKVLVGTPCVGICRGAQFLNVMAGGEMYQNVSGHTRSHSIKDATTGEEVFCTSTHHQMMKPSSQAVLVASSTIGGIRTYWNEVIESFVTEVSDVDYEVVYYPVQDYLCFQPHPEMFLNRGEYEGMRNYFFECLSKYLKV